MYLDKAAEVAPDSAIYHMRGRFFYEVYFHFFRLCAVSSQILHQDTSATPQPKDWDISS